MSLPPSSFKPFLKIIRSTLGDYPDFKKKVDDIKKNKALIKNLRHSVLFQTMSEEKCEDQAKPIHTQYISNGSSYPPSMQTSAQYELRNIIFPPNTDLATQLFMCQYPQFFNLPTAPISTNAKETQQNLKRGGEESSEQNPPAKKAKEE